EADAEDRQPACEFADRLDRDTGFGRRARPRRDHEPSDAAGHALAQFVDRDFVVAKHLDIGAEFAEVLHQVVGEAVVVVDHQQLHGLTPILYTPLTTGNTLKLMRRPSLSPDRRTAACARARWRSVSASTAFTSTTVDCSTTKSARQTSPSGRPL